VNPIDDSARQLAEAAIRIIEMAEHIGLPDSLEKLGVTPIALGLIARAYIEQRKQLRALHDLIDLTDPNDPIGVALTKVGLEHKLPEPQAWTKPRLMRSPVQVEMLSSKDLLTLYCRVMQVPAASFTYETYVVRLWDGMDGCWTDCTTEVSRDKALQHWAEKAGGGTHHVSYSEIDYFLIFPGGTRMQWDGTEGREMHR
jgi:hypothetical protein